jgi:uncharacterized protein
MPPKTTSSETTSMTNKRIYIIHGYGASPSDRGFPWLKSKLEREGAKVTVLKMPNSKKPDASNWFDFMRSNIKSPDGNTYFVAHSLGCIALLRYLDSLGSGTKVGGVVLVSGFSESLPELPELNGFVAKKLNADRLIEMSSHRAVIASLDDPIVPHAKTERLSVLLKAKLHLVKSGGHFLATDGFTQLPEAYEELSVMVKKV